MTNNYVIMCRSVTYAQRAVKILERSGERAHMVKAPQGLTPEGCSYGVSLRSREPGTAVDKLKEAGVRIGRVYSVEMGQWLEVEL